MRRVASGRLIGPAGTGVPTVFREDAPPRRGARPRLLPTSAPPWLLGGDAAAFAVSLLVPSTGGPALLLLLPVLLVCLRLGGLYRSRLTLSVLDDLPYLLGGWAVVLAVELSGRFLVGVETTTSEVLVRAGVLLAALLLVRTAAYTTVRTSRRRGRVRHATLVMGAGHIGIRVASTLQQHPEFGLAPVGFVDSAPRVDDLSMLPAPLLGECSRLSSLVQELSVKVVIVAYGSVPECDLVDVLRTCDRLQCDIILVPRLFEVHPVTRDADDLRGIPLVRVRRAPFRTWGWHAKRGLDVVVAAVGLVALSPVLAACALAVRCEGGPGVLFHQQRVGLDGRPFEMLKFRSLKPASGDESATAWNVAHDARLGPVGRFLRQTSLDELPQLWNVLVGDMSLVGPRPERPYFVQQFAVRVPRYTARQRVPSGLTGWAQVNGLRGDTSIEDRADFDNHYIENWSLWTDVKILARTVQQVVLRRGA